MVQKLKYAVLLSSLAASSTLFAQNTPPAQTPGAAAKPAQVAQAPAAAPAAGAAGTQAAGVAVGTAGATAGAGIAFVPAVVAASMATVSAAAISEAGDNTSSAVTHK
jgi:hypothetical protein